MSVENFVKRNARHIIVISGLIVAFTLHNYMQELIMSQPNFKFGAILAFLDVLGVTVFSGHCHCHSPVVMLCTTKNILTTERIRR